MTEPVRDDPCRSQHIVERQKLRIVDALAFLCEVALIVLLAISGSRLVPELVGRILLAIALPLTAIVIWSVWMAPTSKRRLRDPWRWIAQAAVFGAAASLAAVANLALWGIALAVLGIATFGLSRLRRATD
jgi:hypothetical protein